MNTPSEEQQTVIDNISIGKNVIVDACAGSGKSTTVLSNAIALPQYNFIQLTFNKALQSEVQEKIHELKLNNISVYTFHGLAVKYYSSLCHNDMGLRKILREKTKPQIPLPQCNIMVIDECQDATKVYFDLIWNFCMELQNNIQLLILGDEKQGLYGFKGSDVRLLTMAEHCWKYFPKLASNDFIHLSLRMSYRITDPMCRFLNEVMLDEQRVISCKPGVPVMYIRRSINEIESLYYIMRHLMQEEGAKYDDFFCLFRSLKASSFYVGRLENLLVKHNVPVFIPNNDSKDDLDSRVIQNKVVFSTFHASKGRQRKYVFVLGFDETHFTFFATDKEPTVCPNELYVACTRATKKLIVWEDMGNSSYILPFLKYNHIKLMKCPFVSFNGTPSGRKPEIPEKPMTDINKRNITPSEFVRFLSEHTLDIIAPLIDEMFVTITPPYDVPLDIPSVLETSTSSHEEVSDLNGIVIPLMFFDYLRDSYEPILQRLIKANMKDVPKEKHRFLYEAVENMPTICETTRDYLYVANLFTATQDFLYSRFKQILIQDYKWISQYTINQCFEQLEIKMREELEDKTWNAEVPIIQYNDEIEHTTIDEILASRLQDHTSIYRFSARADLVTNDSLWELKCTSQLNIDHKLQLVIYAFLNHFKYDGNIDHKKYHLYNIKTNEHLELKATPEQLITIIVEIIKNKYYKVPELTDEEFLQQFAETDVQNSTIYSSK